MKLGFSQVLRMSADATLYSITRPRFADYRPEDVNFYKDPAPVFQRMADEAPIFYRAKSMAWIVSGGYEVCFNLLRDERLSPSFKEWKYLASMDYKSASEFDRITDNMLMSLGKKDHTRVRRLSLPAFSPKWLNHIEPTISDMIKKKFDRVDGSEIDIISIINDIPLEATSIFVGMSEANIQKFAAVGDAILSNYNPTATVDFQIASEGIAAIRTLFKESLGKDSKDFIGLLANNVEQGDRISEDEAVALIASLLAAGKDTLMSFISTIILNFARNPHVVQELITSPELLEKAMYESFRYDNGGHSGLVRFAKEDFELLGQHIKKGEMIRIMNHSAARDSRVFANPDVMDIHRHNADKIVVFGLGPHYCLGSALARMVSTTVMKCILEKYPRLSLAGEPTYEKSVMSRKLVKLPICNSR